MSARLLLAAAWLVVGTTCLAQPKPDEATELAEFLADARGYAISAGPAAPLKLHEPPVFNFTNPERNQERGSVFVWLRDGRPAAIGQFFRFNLSTGRLKKHALHSLADGPLTATVGERTAWTPDGPGVEWKPVPDAPAPAATRAARLLQMRQLARPFKLVLHDPKGPTTDLRPAPRPLFEYAAPKAGVTDGAIFSYVVATDPEAVLLVEATDDGTFRYAFARFHFWRLTATRNDKPVWDVPYDPAQMRNTLGHPDSVRKPYSSFHP